MIALVGREGRALLAAILYFTRLPLPLRAVLAEDDWQRATAWWPLIGMGVGAVVAGVIVAAGQFFPSAVAAGLGLAAGLLLTGALQEDGFADSCDGFGGGGADRGRILDIMRDSRLGTFGVAGLVMLLGLKWQVLVALPPAGLLALLVAAHAASRAMAAALMAVLPYARSDASKASHVTGRMAWARLVLLLGLGLAPLGLLPGDLALAAIGLLVVLWGLAAVFLRRRLGGYTGDCLGAAQQVGEMALLLLGLCVS
jgi:adenosylcobinamide-GDP ribazoletransferase